MSVPDSYTTFIKKRIRKNEIGVDNDLSSEEEKWINELDAQMSDNSNKPNLTLISRKQLVRYVKELPFKEERKKILEDYKITEEELNENMAINLGNPIGIKNMDPELKNYLKIKDSESSSSTLNSEENLFDEKVEQKYAKSEQPGEMSPMKLHLIKSQDRTSPSTVSLSTYKSTSSSSTSSDDDDTSCTSSANEEIPAKMPKLSIPRKIIRPSRLSIHMLKTPLTCENLLRANEKDDNEVPVLPKEHEYLKTESPEKIKPAPSLSPKEDFMSLLKLEPTPLESPSNLSQSSNGSTQTVVCDNSASEYFMSEHSSDSADSLSVQGTPIVQRLRSSKRTSKRSINSQDSWSVTEEDKILITESKVSQTGKQGPRQLSSEHDSSSLLCSSNAEAPFHSHDSMSPKEKNKKLITGKQGSRKFSSNHDSVSLSHSSTEVPFNSQDSLSSKEDDRKLITEVQASETEKQSPKRAFSTDPDYVGLFCRSFSSASTNPQDIWSFKEEKQLIIGSQTCNTEDKSPIQFSSGHYSACLENDDDFTKTLLSIRSRISIFHMPPYLMSFTRYLPPYEDPVSFKSLDKSQEETKLEDFIKLDDLFYEYRCPREFNSDDEESSEELSNLETFGPKRPVGGMLLRSGKAKLTTYDKLLNLLISFFNNLSINDTDDSLGKVELLEGIKSPAPAFVTLASGKKRRLKADNIVKVARHIYKANTSKKKQDSSNDETRKEELLKEKAGVVRVHSTQDNTKYSFGRDCINLIVKKELSLCPKPTLCAMNCGKIKAYTCTLTGVPVCSLPCYKRSMKYYIRSLVRSLLYATDEPERDN